MRKKCLLVWFMVFMITLSLFGCHESDSPSKHSDAEGIDPDVALTLRKDYLRQFRSEYPDIEVTLEDINVQAHYGTYSGCEVVYMGEPLGYTQAFRSVVVAGYIITLGSSQKLYVHKDSHFYTIKEAYDAGYITTEDVENFGPKVTSKFRKWSPPPTHTPHPDVEGVDPAVALTLRKDYLQQLRSEDPKMEITLDDIYVQDYYGTYSGCEIVYMGAPLVYTMAERRVVVAGYIITLGSGQKLYVHKDSHFYTLNEAYVTGCITKEDVEDFGPKVDEHYFKKWDGEKIWYDNGSMTTNPVG